MITFKGFSTAITRGDRRFKSSRTLFSSMAASTVVSRLATPTLWQKSRIASGV